MESGDSDSECEIIIVDDQEDVERPQCWDFRLHCLLGRGRFGQVLLASHEKRRRNFHTNQTRRRRMASCVPATPLSSQKRKPTGELVALKILHKKMLRNAKMRERAKNERRINGLLAKEDECLFVVKMRSAFRTDKHLCLALELLPCGDLFRFARKKSFSENQARFYASECLRALSFLHARHVLYRDLKLENVLLTAEGHVKISDFGLSKPGVPEFLRGATSLCGTPEFLSPEMLAPGHVHGLAVDFWALGCLLFELLDGKPPFRFSETSSSPPKKVASATSLKNFSSAINHSSPTKTKSRQKKDQQELFETIRSAPLRTPRRDSALRPPTWNVLQSLLTKDPSKRLGAKNGAEDIKAHPFFADIDWKTVAEPPFCPPQRSFSRKTTSWADVDTTFDDDERDLDVSMERFDQIFANWDSAPPPLVVAKSPASDEHNEPDVTAAQVVSSSEPPPAEDEDEEDEEEPPEEEEEEDDVVIQDDDDAAENDEPRQSEAAERAERRFEVDNTPTPPGTKEAPLSPSKEEAPLLAAARKDKRRPRSYLRRPESVHCKFGGLPVVLGKASA